MAVSDYVQELDLRRGVLARRFRDHATPRGGGRAVAQRRLVSMADPYLAALEATVRRRELVGPARRCAPGIDGRVSNAGVARYRELGQPALDRRSCAARRTTDLVA